MAFTIKSSKDGYTSNVATGTLVNTSTWVLYTPSTISTSSVNSSPVTFRVYGHNGTGTVSLGTANWRIDDLKLNLTLTPGRGLSSSTTSSLCSGSSFTYNPTTNYTGATLTWTRASVSGISNAAIITPQTSNPNEVLINTSSSPIDVIYTYTITTSSCFVTDNVTVTVNPITNWYLDADNDGYYIGSAISQCDSPGVGYRNSGLIAGNDCDDSNPSLYQSGTLYIDADGDGYDSGTAVVCYGAIVPTGYSLTTLGADCNDADATHNLSNPCSSIVNLKLFVEGYYRGSGAMTSVKFNQDGVSATTDVTDVTVELHDTIFSSVATTVATVHTDGTATCTFATAPSGSFYIAVLGSNFIQTWSANPVTVGGSPFSYDFTTSASQAYGDNMVEVESGVFAFYSGDINQDLNVDASDYSLWESDANDFAYGVYPTDLNGDGNVDASDYSIWENNANNFIYAIIIPEVFSKKRHQSKRLTNKH